MVLGYFRSCDGDVFVVFHDDGVDAVSDIGDDYGNCDNNGDDCDDDCG